MGHLRPRAFPRTQRWTDVVELINSSDNLEAVAEAAFRAACTGLEQVPKDPGFLLVLAGIFQFTDGLRSKDPIRALKDEGFSVSQLSTLLDYTTGLRQNIDSQLSHTRTRSDLSELALNSISEALSRQTSAAEPSLFAATPQESLATVRSQVTGRRFTGLMHEFYSVFTRRYLSYYLSRELPKHVGGEATRFANMRDHREFSQAFDRYVRQS